MPSVTIIKNEREFYRDFHSLVNVLKTVAISQFHSLERKMQTYEEFIEAVESFFTLMDVGSIDHPFVNPKEDMPLGIVAITSDKGLLGGLNHRVMTAAFGYMEGPRNQLTVVGQEGQKFVQGLNISFKGFTFGEDEERYLRALELRDHIIDEVISGRVGPVKVIYPYASSIQIQKVMEMDLLPCTKWPRKDGKQWSDPLEEDVLLESYPSHLVEYLVYLLMAQKLFEIMQFARLAEFAARTTHLEESSDKIKEIDKKLQRKYFRARHEVIDQQMRELFAARALYAEQNG
ncbi:MAG: F0F1 ATP synthase subunit gamma [Candidatus Omnitrophica bacterium]|nr:F0F1 ATP synthase subunit gamma [Candidatus Omnitrophota bacterium]